MFANLFCFANLTKLGHLATGVLISELGSVTLSLNFRSYGNILVADKQKAKSDPSIPTCVGCERVRWQQKKILVAEATWKFLIFFSFRRQHQKL
jgi:hypothetical protein